MFVQMHKKSLCQQCIARPLTRRQLHGISESTRGILSSILLCRLLQQGSALSAFLPRAGLLTRSCGALRIWLWHDIPVDAAGCSTRLSSVCWLKFHPWQSDCHGLDMSSQTGPALKPMPDQCHTANHVGSQQILHTSILAVPDNTLWHLWLVAACLKTNQIPCPKSCALLAIKA